jgi:hypothetical protein
MSVKTAQVDAEIRQLRGFAELEGDWNAHGAKRIAPYAIDLAINLVRRVASVSGVAPDFVAPLANGGVQLEWGGENTEIEVEVHPDRRFSYLLKGASRIEKHNVPLSEILEAITVAIAS